MLIMFPTPVVFTLTARAPGPSFIDPERKLKLTREKPSVPIGRASKVPSKGFTAAVNNAWFESPVMSREHAEIVADFDTDPTVSMFAMHPSPLLTYIFFKTLYVQDVGSLHGTYHRRGNSTGKEQRLEQRQQVTLESGDVLRFGIDIYRSKETFPPCSVDFVLAKGAEIRFVESCFAQLLYSS
jgi:pSer/pThr/pTyr-binding forkhead associated (FHA) protein